MTGTIYLHITNLHVPFDLTDRSMLAVLEDYRIGRPVRATHAEAVSDETLKEQGFIGLYVSREEIETNLDFRRLTKLTWRDLSGVNFIPLA